MMSKFRFKAFISYSHEDKKWSKWLLNSIETYRVPRRLVGRTTERGIIPDRLTPIFRDRNELAAAEDLSAEVKRALAQSEFLIVICSPSAASSNWVNQEILEFKRAHGEANILSVIVAGEPSASDQETGKDECFPKALRLRLGQDGELSTILTEPIAANLRIGGDGRRLALMKLVAGMIGVSPDEIIRRDLQRRYRTVMAITVAAALAVVVTGALAIFALQARDEAERQRAEAEGLIEFMLTDLREKLEPVGRLDVLDAVGTKAIDYYSAQRLWDMPEDSLGRRARAFHLLGEVDKLKGDLPGASAKFEEAMKTTAQSLKRRPDDPQAIYDHAQSVFWTGYMELERGNYDAAKRAMEQYRDLSYRLTAADPENLDWRLEAAYADSNLGVLLLNNMANPAEAYTSFNIALQNYRIIAEARPDSRSVQIGLADSHAWLADTNAIIGSLSETLSSRQSQVSIYDALLAKDSEDFGILSRKLNAQLAISRLALMTGNAGGAVNLLTSVVDTAQDLLAHDPENARWLERETDYIFYLSDTLLSMGDLPSAEQGLVRGEELVRSLESSRKLAANQKISLTYFGNLVRARLEFYRLNLEETRLLTKKIVQGLTADFEGKKRPIRATRILVSALVLSGLAAEAIGDETGAKSQWQAAIDLTEAQIDTLDPETLEQLMRAYALIGMPDKALDLSEGLKQRGYAHPRFVGFMSNQFQQ